jgi:hypothetical protein
VRWQLQLRNRLSEAETKQLLGKKGKASDAAVLLHEEASVFKPDGSRLLTVIRGQIDEQLIEAAFPFMWEMRKIESNNRGAYAGEDRDMSSTDNREYINAGLRWMAIKKDGTLSKTYHAPAVRSVVAGAFDRSPRIPYCRETAYSKQFPEKWGAAFPFIQRVGEIFKEVVPERHAVQLEVAQKTHPAYVIPGTPFTTLTINNTVVGAYHTDKGDFKSGFGVMAVFRKGTYRGAEIVFPRYGVGADLQHGDVIFFDPHEVHGNLPFHDGVGHEGEDWVRISMVFYFRSRMVECLEPKAELERVKNLRGGISG